MVMPRIVTPLITLFIYFISFWVAFPFHIEKIKYVWSPPTRVGLLHDYLPAFGDFQFLGASFITSTPDLTHISNYLINIGFYFLIVSAVLLIHFNRKQIWQTGKKSNNVRFVISIEGRNLVFSVCYETSSREARDSRRPLETFYRFILRSLHKRCFGRETDGEPVLNA